LAPAFYEVEHPACGHASRQQTGEEHIGLSVDQRGSFASLKLSWRMKSNIE
jgi:hypothetical protein